MAIDLTTLSEAELVDLNRRVVERLHMIRKARQLMALAHFSVGMAVEVTVDDGRVIRGAISRINRQSATIVSPLGSWRVSPSLLRLPVKPHTTGVPPQPLVFRKQRQAD